MLCVATSIDYSGCCDAFTDWAAFDGYGGRCMCAAPEDAGGQQVPRAFAELGVLPMFGDADQLVGHLPGREDVATAGQVCDFSECAAPGGIRAEPVAVIGDTRRLGWLPRGR